MGRYWRNRQLRFERVRGGGKAIGEDVLITNSTFDKPSYATDQADVWNSTFHTARAIGDAKVRSSLIEFSTVGCKRLPSEVMQSHFVHSKMFGGTCINALVVNSTIMGLPQIRGTQNGVKILGSTIRDRAIVEGTAIVKGVTLRDYMRVSEGLWLREPRYETFIEPEMCEIGVTEATDGYAHIGCNRRKMADWIRKRTLWVKAAGWTDEMGIRLARILESWLDEPLPTN